MGSGNDLNSPSESIDQTGKWTAYAESFRSNSYSGFEALKELNEELAAKSVLLGNGLKPSDADDVVFSAIYSSLIGLLDSDREKLPHLRRWMDYIQSKVDLGDKFAKLSLEKSKFEPQKKATGNKEAAQEKKNAPEADKAKKDEEVSVSLLNIQVGLIRKAWKHPSADSLLVEEIDVGEAKLRQVVSGLAKYCSPEDLTNRHVVLITNVKQGKLRDVASEGLVLCASSEDHSAVEPLLPPEGAKPGERVSFAGIDGKPEDVLNPKKKQLDKITPHLFTDNKGVATYKGIPFMTSAGPCTSSIAKASIK